MYPQCSGGSAGLGCSVPHGLSTSEPWPGVALLLACKLLKLRACISLMQAPQAACVHLCRASAYLHGATAIMIVSCACIFAGFTVKMMMQCGSMKKRGDGCLGTTGYDFGRYGGMYISTF